MSPSSSASPSIAPEACVAWGEATPGAGKEAKSWAHWQESPAAIPVTVQGDADFGKVEVPDDSSIYSDVTNTGDADAKTFTITRDSYGSGSGNVTIYIRGQASAFTQHAGAPSWSVYSVPTNQAWQYVQVRMDYVF